MTTANLVYDLEQGGPEWLEMRKGMATGSMIRHATGKMKRQPKEGPTAYLQGRENYMIDIVTTRLTGSMSDRYVSTAMEEGTEREPLAISAYEQNQDVMVEPIGFAFHPTIKWFGASPDGVIGSDIVLEVKCPTQATHVRYWLEFKDAQSKGLEYVPEEYLPQVKSEISCTERHICHFVSYHPYFPENLQLLISPYHRDKGMIEEQDREVEKFLNEAAELEAQLRAFR